MYSVLLEKILTLFSFKIIRFLFIGGINTLLSFLIFSTLFYIGLHYFIASLLTLIIGMFISFNTHKGSLFSLNQ